MTGYSGGQAQSPKKSANSKSDLGGLAVIFEMID